MKYPTVAQAPAALPHPPAAAPRPHVILLALALLLLVCPSVLARQAPKRLPAPEKIVAEYLKATGGRKRHAAVRDAVYEWAVSSARGESRARVLTKAPASVRTELRGADGVEVSTTANPRMAWR
ncbi:MAG: hypothetical protein ICV73_30390, partial [Acetobacteraceae bacterium]|nr:hypothetical protein [Acetobacteraceae bacterium]